MRLFTGIAPSKSVIGNLESVVAPLRPLADARWSPTANFHVTTRFIGDWPDAQLDRLDSALSQILIPAPFIMDITGLHFFPNASSPRVLFAGTSASPGLQTLARETESTLAALGCPSVTRPFTPHLTLARLRNENMGDLAKQITPSMSVHNFGSFPVTAFHLYLSETGPTGSVYTPLRTYHA